MKNITPLEAAKKLIEHYALRGDDLKSLMRGRTGCACSEFHAQIGGRIDDVANNGLFKCHGSDKIVVYEVNGKEVNQVFSLKKVYEEIMSKQQVLIFK